VQQLSATLTAIELRTVAVVEQVLLLADAALFVHGVALVAERSQVIA
jgi:hypothetical protein